MTSSGRLKRSVPGIFTIRKFYRSEAKCWSKPKHFNFSEQYNVHMTTSIIAIYSLQKFAKCHMKIPPIRFVVLIYSTGNIKNQCDIKSFKSDQIIKKQRGRVVRRSDLKSEYRRFRYCCDH